MRKIGVREAKARLSEILKDVERGRAWTITARGRPIARLIPVATKETVEEWIARLEREGRILRPRAADRPFRPLNVSPQVGALLRKYLEEDRDAT
ncbi:MAG: type II toxin-antitoxin system Phd/YefM family antitoxin [bacterium]